MKGYYDVKRRGRKKIRKESEGKAVMMGSCGVRCNHEVEQVERGRGGPTYLRSCTCRKEKRKGRRRGNSGLHIHA